MKIYQSICKSAEAGRKQFAVLIDPDKNDPTSLKRITTLAEKAGVDYFFFGGSLLMNDHLDQFITYIRDHSDIPVLLFPGNSLQINKKANGILLLSLISGRNPDLLIGRHVISAPFLRESNLEILPTGYMLIESGPVTTVAYMSNTTPIPSGKDEIGACTAMAGEMLGLKLIYLDAGSGAMNPVPIKMISRVRHSVSIPVIVGGGITSPGMAVTALSAGADVVVVGNAIERDPGLIGKIADAIGQMTNDK